MHLPDGRLAVVLPFLHKSRRELVDIVADAEAVLADQHDFVARRPVDAVDDHAVRMIFPGPDLELALVFGAGSDVVMGLSAVLVRDVQVVEIDKFVACLLCDLVNGYHRVVLLIY